MSFWDFADKHPDHGTIIFIAFLVALMLIMKVFISIWIGHPISIYGDEEEDEEDGP